MAGCTTHSNSPYLSIKIHKQLLMMFIKAQAHVLNSIQNASSLVIQKIGKEAYRAAAWEGSSTAIGRRHM